MRRVSRKPAHAAVSTALWAMSSSFACAHEAQVNLRPPNRFPILIRSRDGRAMQRLGRFCTAEEFPATEVAINCQRQIVLCFPSVRINSGRSSMRMPDV